MKYVKALFDFYINASIHVALSVYALARITLFEYDLAFDKPVLCFVFFGTITGYNFVKYFGVAKFHHRSLTTKLKAIQIFSFFSFLLMGYFGLQLERQTIFYIVVLGGVTFLYAIPFLPKRLFLDEEQNLRSIGGLKIYLIALVWTGVTVVLPLVNASFSVTNDALVLAMQRYIFIIVLMLPFEIRDMRYDSLKLSTVPQTIGVKVTKIIGVFLLVIFFFLEFFKNEMEILKILILFLVTVIILLFLVFSKKEQEKYYSSFWVESLPVFWLLLILFRDFFF